MGKRPYVLGGLLLLAGYAWGFATQTRRPVSRELLAFYRREQMAKLRRIVSGFLGRGGRRSEP
jgi:hypothetical protein